MQFLIKNKLVSWGGSSTVKDMYGNDVFTVEGKVFSATRKKFIKDMQGNIKYMVRNKFWTWFAKKAIVYDSENNEVFTIRRKIFSFHDRYMIESTMGNFDIKGNILGFDYHIVLDGNEIGHIARNLSFVDSFTLDIPDNVDYALYTAIVIAIDLITDSRRRDSESSFDND